MRSWTRGALLAAAALPAALSLGLILKYGVNVPFQDEWDTPGILVKKWAEGTAGWGDLFAQHNESRPAVPRLIVSAIIFLAGWNTVTAMVLGWCAALGAFLGLFRLFLGPAGRPDGAAAWVLLLMSGFVFSTAQATNWLMGHQVALFISPLCLVLAQAWQASGRNRPMVWWGCAALSWTAQYSFANGVLCWIFAFPLWREWAGNWQESPPEKKRAEYKHAAGYAVLAAASTLAYFWNYRKPPTLPGWEMALRDPLAACHYFAAWLGKPLLGYLPRLIGAPVVGGVALLIGALTLFWIWKNWRRWEASRRQAAVPWLALLFYALATGAITTGGRLGFGISQALASRYVTFSLYFYVASLALCYLLWQSRAEARKESGSLCFGGILGTVSILLVAAWLRGAEHMRADAFDRRQAVTTLRLLEQIPDNPLLETLYPKIESVVERERFFVARGIYRREPFGEWLMPAVRDPAGDAAGDVEVDGMGTGQWSVSGWAYLRDKGRAPDLVVLATREREGSLRLRTALLCGLPRKEVAERKGWNGREGIGFRAEGGKAWGRAGETWEAFAVDLPGRQAYRLPPVREAPP
jgi:hypothetical protein